jgi:lipid-A-disaccharide synthase
MSPVLNVAIVVGEESGDQLGFKLMQALRLATKSQISFRGVGGTRMADEGLASLFPLHDIAVMGFTAVVPRLPTLVRRVYATVDAIVRNPPDILVIIDSPDFTHAVAKRVRRKLPKLPIVDYVSPSVWAWRSGRARSMRTYVDHVLALLPFEPSVHERLSGPPCTYVGHPLIERLNVLTPDESDEAARSGATPTLLVMPGSRRAIAARMLPVFRDTVARLGGHVDVVMPTVPALADQFARETAAWPVPVRIVVGEAPKFQAFRRARAALVCSGTSSLELALAGVPMAVGYRLPPLESLFVFLVRVPSIVLPNLIVGENVVPEFLHGPCRPEVLAPAVNHLLGSTPARIRQVEAFRRLRQIMTLDNGETPSGRAARVILETFETKTGRSAPRR